MIPLALAVAAAYGVHLLWTASAMGWNGLGPGPKRTGPPRLAPAVRTWLRQAGLEQGDVRDVAAASTAVAVVCGALAMAVFGAAVPAVAVAACALVVPPAALRDRRRRRMEVAREAWPGLIEEIRAGTTSGGRSVPHALFEAGRRAPAQLRGAFGAAEREWLLTTDLQRALHVLRDRLADPTADAVGETLLVAHGLGGTDLDGRLRALAEDRRQDLHQRRDARAAQAGVRFARRFVLLVPAAMALAGLSIGNGRAAYATPGGQLAVTCGVAGVAACWVWSGRMLRLPGEERVFR